MTLFFLLVGLELKREILAGELSSFRDAALPVVAALGGMVEPAATVYSSCSWQNGLQNLATTISQLRVELFLMESLWTMDYWPRS